MPKTVDRIPRDDENIGAALTRLVMEGKPPKKIMQEIRRAYPKVSNRQIVRLALFQMIDRADDDLVASRSLQNFAISERKPN